jgi:hypothetical protein
MINLSSDHTIGKSSNNHKLPPPCEICKLEFVDKEAKEKHLNSLRDRTAFCPEYTPEELHNKNLIPNRMGISENSIKRVLKILGSLKMDCLPVEFNKSEFYRWVSRNATIYRGKSSIAPKDAEREIGKWLAIFITLFPNDKWPSNPCKEM